MIRLVVVALLFCIGVEAWPRDTDGALQSIVFPNEGRSAVTIPGGTFSVLATREVELTLRDGDVIVPLQATWRRVPGARFEAVCVVPRGCEPGRYAIVSGDGDMNPGSVTVLREVPESYAVAHVAAPRFPLEHAEALAASINAQSPALVVLSGEVTSSGSDAEMAQVLAFLRDLNAPALVTPGPNDDRAGQFTRFFGPPVYALRIGADAFMSVGVDAIQREEHYGPMYRTRRAVRDARWSVGVASVDPIQWPMRAQLALFVDDPLDFLLIPGGTTAAQGEVRWGSTITLQTPDAAHAQWRLLRVEPFTPSPGEIVGLDANEEPESDEP